MLSQTHRRPHRQGTAPGSQRPRQRGNRRHPSRRASAPLRLRHEHGHQKRAHRVPGRSGLQQSTDLETRLTLSRYFQTTRVFSTREAEEKLRTHEADAFIALQSNAPDTLHNGTRKSRLSSTSQRQPGHPHPQLPSGRRRLWASSWAADSPVLDVQTRTRFNEANDSHYYLVPGVIVTIMTMIGALLTSLVMAREYERGTLESLFVTPVGSGEILTAKAATNFLLGMVSLAISMVFAAFVFGIPIRGSLTLLLAVSALFLIVALGLGLVISTATKNQFLACQFAIMGTFMPALMLSGFLYDILNMPPAVRALTYMIPARYYVTLLQTLFLAGDIPSVIIPCCITLGVFAVVLMGIARLKAPKSLE
ncbi:MAG: ABC transporter permease [Akkermansia sp.]